MVTVKVARATSWAQVEEAAGITQRCIQPQGDRIAPGSNWAKAQETWELLKDDIVYFILTEPSYPNQIKGYARLFNTTPGFNYVNNPTWAIDYMWPSSAEAVVLIADLLPGNVLVKAFFSNDPLVRHWPKVALGLAIPDVPYRVHSEKVADWLVVIP